MSKKVVTKVVTKAKQVVIMLVVAGFFLIHAESAKAAGTTFGITAQKTKIGDADGHPTYGPGQHNVVSDGNEVYTAYTNKNVIGEIEVCIGKSLDGGLKWERNEVIAHSIKIASDGASIAVGPDPLNPPGKIIHVAWGENDPINPNPQNLWLGVDALKEYNRFDAGNSGWYTRR